MSEKLSIKDIVEFAKAGWKPTDVTKIIEASKQEPEVPDSDEKPAETGPKEDSQPEQEKPEEPEKEDVSEDKIKALEKQVEELNKKLKSAQDANTSRNLQDKVQTEQEKLEEIARSFM